MIICTRGPQSLSCLRARRDHDPALTRTRQKWTSNGRRACLPPFIISAYTSFTRWPIMLWKCICGKRFLWPWPLNQWPSQHHQCHIDKRNKADSRHGQTRRRTDARGQPDCLMPPDHIQPAEEQKLLIINWCYLVWTCVVGALEVVKFWWNLALTFNTETYC